MKHITTWLGPILLGSCFLACSSSSPEPTPEPEKPVERPPQQVMTWVSVWGIDEARLMLDASYGAVRVEDTLDRIGLQFWTIREDGGVDLFLDTAPETARWFVERGHASGKKVLGTVVNEEFDWEVTRGALGDGGGVDVAARLGEVVDEFELDGIDIDFETGSALEGDREEFAAFIEALSAEMKTRDKLLTINSFYTESNGAPGPLWWPDWVGFVDTIQVMGYDKTYWSGPGSAGYQALQNRAMDAGFKANQLLLGLPVWLDAWGAAGATPPTNVDNLRFITHCLKHPTGVALWSISDPLSPSLPQQRHPWSSEDVWQSLLELHDGVIVDDEFCRDSEREADVIDDMSALALNHAGGIWLAVSDYWSRPSTDTALASEVLMSDLDYDLARGEGSWGKTERGYTTLETGQSVLATRMKTVARIGSAAAFASMHMEFMPRSCDRLEDPSDGCGWRPEALVERDLSGSKKLVVGLRCDAGEKLRFELLNRQGAIDYAAPYVVEVECTGEFEDYDIVFADLKQESGENLGFDASRAASLDIEFSDSNPPSEVAVTIAGVALDRSVLELRGLR